MIITEEIKQSLQSQVFCPKCGVSYKALEDSLYEGLNSENYQIARTIINNCKICQMRFDKEM